MSPYGHEARLMKKVMHTQYGLRRFRNGDESLQDEERCRRPLVIDDSQLRAIVEADPLKTTGDVAEELDVVLFGSCSTFAPNREIKKAR
uniref:HTH_48 domain-containing protein n=1 Tax=Heterorhabditis bacteriophora TaxID=37862 RepID=A0A1I7XKZ8_HETBA